MNRFLLALVFVLAFSFTSVNAQNFSTHQVKEGETIMILEAMKMKNQIKMPFDGKIGKIHIVEGSKVPNRLLMVEIE